MTPRIKTAAVATVLVGALAGPSVTGAVASTHHAKRSTQARTAKRELKELKALRARETRAGDTSTTPPTGPELAIDDAIQNLEFDLSSDGIQATLGDLPLVGDYG